MPRHQKKKEASGKNKRPEKLRIKSNHRHTKIAKKTKGGQFGLLTFTEKTLFILSFYY
jgi:hypothetical protein